MDKVPAQATLAFNLGTTVDGRFEPDIHFLDRPPKKRHIGFSSQGDEGALLFEAAIADWEDVYDVRGILGTRWAKAFLLGAGQEILAESDRVEIVLDHLPAKLMEISLPEQVVEGTPSLEVRCKVTPSASRVTSVDFVTGTKPAAEADFPKADDEGKMIKGAMVQANDQRIWQAQIPIDKLTPGKLVVTARATNEVGLTDILSHTITIRPKPAPAPTEEAKAKMDSKPGSVEGTVIESNVVRAGFTVYLIDPKEKEPEKGVKETRTKDDGSFSFEKVAPGNYTLYCQNPETKRLDRQTVTVEAGKATTKKLELLLP